MNIKEHHYYIEKQMEDYNAIRYIVNCLQGPVSTVNSESALDLCEALKNFDEYVYVPEVIIAEKSILSKIKDIISLEISSVSSSISIINNSEGISKKIKATMEKYITDLIDDYNSLILICDKSIDHSTSPGDLIESYASRIKSIIKSLDRNYCASDELIDSICGIIINTFRELYTKLQEKQNSMCLEEGDDNNVTL